MSADVHQRLAEWPGALPALGEPGSESRFELGAALSAERTRLTPLEAICDLGCYGLVAASWPLSNTAAPSATGGGTCVGFVEATPDCVPDLSNYSVSGAARAVATRLQLPLVNTNLLALIALADRWPSGEFTVALPSSQPDAFLNRLKASTRAVVRGRIAVLRERRRIALGLPVRSSDLLLDHQIDHAFVFPMARAYLTACVGPAAQRIHLQRAANTDPAPAHPIVLGKFEANDPLGLNVFALAMRRLFYENSGSEAGRWFELNPFALGSSLARHGGRTPKGAGEAMLAALQMDLVAFVPAAPPRYRP